MPLNFKRQVLLQEHSVARCTKCKKVYDDKKRFCPECGTELSVEKIKVYANYGKRGLTSYTFKLPNGISFNSKGTMTLPLAEGVSYTSKI